MKTQNIFSFDFFSFLLLVEVIGVIFFNWTKRKILEYKVLWYLSILNNEGNWFSLYFLCLWAPCLSLQTTVFEDNDYHNRSSWVFSSSQNIRARFSLIHSWTKKNPHHVHIIRILYLDSAIPGISQISYARAFVGTSGKKHILASQKKESGSDLAEQITKYTEKHLVRQHSVSYQNYTHTH